ncbi:MAG: serine/threonine protein kinase [Planctomycetaceae bacterium]|jgi:serine/threonine protein kinase|nr:serine/threonine protein kinase [Planctomycetaceae bacterium]
MVLDGFEQTRRSISSPYMKQIDEVCDDFESAWRRGSRIRIESCLRLVPEPARADLLRELLEIEIALRAQNGESLLFEQYLSRFPEHSELVKKILHCHNNARRLGDYELLEQLGRGGMGVVYKARQIYLNQIVAVKILPEQYMSDDHAVTRFLREMQLIGGLKHPNIVQAYNAGKTNNVHYLVMEYVAGATLQRLVAEMEEKRFRETGRRQSGRNERDKLNRNENKIDKQEVVEDYFNESDSPRQTPRSQPLLPVPSLIPVGAACEAIRQAALGLHHAGQRGLVHRDIKPGNLMLDRHGVIKILDLGLGKFQQDILQNDLSFGPLTQTGTTMGTVDYMAPEQWDDPTSVDVRADIYSLGNTLYFLLHGAPPFDGKNYNSNRAKLMAHIVAEPPALTAVCSDVPPELNRVYLKMAAKDPNDRFHTPLEAAEALAPFASADALRETIPQELLDISDADQTTSSEYDANGGCDTMESYPFSPSRRRTSDQPPPRKSWYRHQEFYAVAFVVSLLLLVIAGGVIRSFWATTSTKIPPEIREPAPQINEPPVALRYDPTERNNIAADLAELPGLSGATWFSETPWFLPFVRQAAANAILQTTEPKNILGEDAKGYLNVNTVYVQNWLYALTQKILPVLTPPQRHLVYDLKTLADSNLDGSEYVAAMETAYQKYAEANKNQPIRAADKNTEAVLLHMISGLKNDRRIAEQAEMKYKETLLEYPQDVVSKQLKLLCMTDYARLIGQSLLKYQEAHSIYEQVRPQAANLLKIDVSTSLGSELAGLGKYDDRPFRSAQRALNAMIDDGTMKSNHPLIAHVAERFAWTLIDQWKINESQSQFQTALDVRKANSLESHKGENPFADIYIFHNMHALAMMARYRGDFSGAKQKYEEVVQSIAAKLKSSEEQLRGAEAVPLPGQLRYFRELRERYSNSQERWADCELFGGAASGAKDANLIRAEKLYAESRVSTNYLATQIVLNCKLSLARALLGKLDDANQNLEELNEQVKNILTDSGRYKVRQIISIVEQVVKVRAAEIEAEKNLDGARPPQKFLEQYEQEIAAFRELLRKIADSSNIFDSDKNRRDSQEIRLFCCEFLLNAEMKRRLWSGQSTLSEKDDVMRFWVTLLFFNDKNETKPFIRPHYDQLLHVADKSDIRTLIGLMRSKLGTPSDFAEGNDAGEAYLLLFQFSPTDNFVVYRSEKFEDAEFCPLTLTREQIKAAANIGKEIDLATEPKLAELLDNVRNARAAGRIVNVFWSDSLCWSDEKSAIADADWPFKTQLTLRETKKENETFSSL